MFSCLQTILDKQNTITIEFKFPRPELNFGSKETRKKVLLLEFEFKSLQTPTMVYGEP